MSAGGIPLASAFVRIRPDGKGFKVDAEKIIGGVDGVGAGGRLGRGFAGGIMGGTRGGLGGFGKVVGGLMMTGIGAAVAGVTAVVSVGLKEAMSAEKLNAQFAAGIKSTKNAAHLSVGTMNELAASVAGYSGQSFESIGMSEQLLQTFTNIKNTGTNKIFDQATEATANMAAKMGGDASGMAIKLGKALNDPVKGMTALSRVGVQFTKGQKDSIAAMVKHGNVVGAQKVILGELTTEFGGAAKAAGETLPGQLARAKVAFGEVSKSVVEGLIPLVMPAIQDIARVVTTQVIPAVKEFVAEFKNGTGAGGEFRDILTTVGGVLGTVAGFIKQNADFLIPFAAVVLTVVAGVRTWIAVQTALNIVMALNPIGLVVIAIAALVAGLVIAYQRSETFRAVVDAAFRGVQKVVGFVVAAVATYMRGMLTVWGTVIGGILSGAATIAEKLHLPFAAGLRKASNSFNDLRNAADNKLKGVAAAALTWGDQTGSNYAAGVSSKTPAVLTASGRLANAAQQKLLINTQPVGAAVGAVFAAGISSSMPAVLTASGRLANAAQQKLTSILHVKSPSKVTEAIGKFFGQGFAVGIDSQRGAVMASASRLVSLPHMGSLDFASPSARSAAVVASAPVVGASSRKTEFHTTIVNPAPETASGSLARTYAKISYLGLDAKDDR
jgi:hypothetical protein